MNTCAIWPEKIFKCIKSFRWIRDSQKVKDETITQPMQPTFVRRWEEKNTSWWDGRQRVEKTSSQSANAESNMGAHLVGLLLTLVSSVHPYNTYSEGGSDERFKVLRLQTENIDQFLTVKKLFDSSTLLRVCHALPIILCCTYKWNSF